MEVQEDPTLGIVLLPPVTERQLQVLSVIHRKVLKHQSYPTGSVAIAR